MSFVEAAHLGSISSLAEMAKRGWEAISLNVREIAILVEDVPPIIQDRSRILSVNEILAVKG